MNELLGRKFTGFAFCGFVFLFRALQTVVFYDRKKLVPFTYLKTNIRPHHVGLAEIWKKDLHFCITISHVFAVHEHYELFVVFQYVENVLENIPHLSHQ